VKGITIFSEKGISLKKKNIRKIIEVLIKELSLKVNFLEFNFVTSETIILINKEHLGHNFSTDIITFDYSSEKNILDGEIFISLPDAEENSKKYKVSVDNELSRLIIHGILHLIGFDDITQAKRKKMKLVEDEFVKKLEKFSKNLIVKK
jgi:probable rRNA maturation factor